jgi:hypothetical protein
VEDGKFLFTRNVEEQQNKLVSRAVAGSWESFVSCKGMLRVELRFNIGVSRPAEAFRLCTHDQGRTGSVLRSQFSCGQPTSTHGNICFTL